MSDEKRERYTTMCIWVDKNAYTDNCDEIKLYDYIQSIIITQSMKRRLFRTRDDYEEFSIYYATEIFMRYRHPKQNEFDENGNRKLDRIKSVSNYVIQTLYFNYLIFLKKYRNFPSKEQPKGLASVAPQFRDSLVETMDGLRSIDFEHNLDRCFDITRDIMSQTPYRKDSVEWHNIYMSCMLTLLNYVTLSREQKRIAKNLNQEGKINQRSLGKQFGINRNSGVKLYRLPDNMTKYIHVLSRKMMKAIASNLSDIVGGYVVADDMIDAVIFDEIPDVLEDYDD